MMCVSMVQYSIITLNWGIQQGDPISPNLFLLRVEALSSLVTQAIREGSLSKVPTSRSGPTISHLFFADDSLPFF